MAHKTPLHDYVARQYSHLREIEKLNLDDRERSLEVRLVIKRIRAVLLFLDGAKNSKLGKLDRKLKTLAKEIGVIRDFDVVTRLIKEREDLFDAKELKKVRKWLPSRAELGSVKKVMTLLTVLEPDLSRQIFKVENSDFDSSLAFVESHLEVKTAIDAVLERESKQTFHELRIQVKRLRFQLEAFLPEDASEKLWRLAEQLKILDRNLGEARDIALLEKVLKKVDREGLREVSVKLKAHRQGLEKAALKVGAKLARG